TPPTGGNDRWERARRSATSGSSGCAEAGASAPKNATAERSQRVVGAFIGSFLPSESGAWETRTDAAVPKNPPCPPGVCGNAAFRGRGLGLASPKREVGTPSLALRAGPRSGSVMILLLVLRRGRLFGRRAGLALVGQHQTGVR